MTAPPRFSSADRHKLLHYLHGSIPLRKQRLLAIAWCRRITHLIPEDIGHTALEAAAQLAEGRPVPFDLERLADHLNYCAFSYIDGFRRERELNIASDTLYATYYAIQPDFKRVRNHVSWAAAYARCPQLGFPAGPMFHDAVQEEQATMWPQLLDVFGNAYQSVTLAPRWRTTNVHELARTIYDEEAFDRLPILADALEDAGCTDRDILDHCRQPGEHVRGCWVVDLVLGKK